MARTTAVCFAAALVGATMSPAFAQSSICSQVDSAATLDGDDRFSRGKRLVREVADLGVIDPNAADDAARCVAAGPEQVALGYRTERGAGTATVAPTPTGSHVTREAQRERVAGIGGPNEGSNQ